MKELKILYVEPDENAQLIHYSILKRYGFKNVVIAEDGVEALGIIKNSDNNFDLIILEMYLPNMSGTQFIKEIKKIPSCDKTPILSLTVLNTTKDINSFLEAGAAVVCNKPIISKEEFIKKINFCLNN